MHIAIGNDHAGLDRKQVIIAFLQSKGHTVDDCGTNSSDSCDYPDYAHKVCTSIQNKSAEQGILICGTGIGMSISANKYIGIRAALVQDIESAKATREHNNSNILCLGARVIDTQTTLDILNIWLETSFEGGRHQRRIDKISQIEQDNYKKSL